MAQDDQESLVTWLSSNKLNFIKDVLIEEEYTLDMIVDMNDNDIDDIFDELKIPKLKKPRFRNAVKRLKQQQQQQQQSQAKPSTLNKTENKNKDDKKQLNEETLESLLSVGDSQRLINPYVIISAIENYSQSKPNGMWQNLEGVKIDVKNMIHLWNDIYNYKNVSIAFKNTVDEKENNNNYNNNNNKNNNKNNNNAMNNGETFEDFLVESRAKINVNKCNDGLIFYYSGHGVKNHIILANGKKYKISDIIEIFNGKNCVYLRNKAKIMIFDCCRGNDISQTYEIKSNDNNELNVLKGPNNPKNEWINRKYHINSGLATIFSNFEDFSISDSSTHGGCLTRSIFKIFENPSKACKYSLRELMIGIRRQTKINSGYGNKDFGVPNELVDFRETLEYKVYFDKYQSVKDSSNNNGNTNIILNNNNSNETKEEEPVDATGKKPQIQVTQQEEEKQGQSESEMKQANTNDIICKYNNIDWQFDFHYGSDNKGCNGKHIECNPQYGSCHCFSTITKHGMVCNSGIYTIKLKIDKINNDRGYGNMIGLTSDNFKNGGSESIDLGTYANGKYDWRTQSLNWIGWSACGLENDERLPNGLYCGSGDTGRTSNIFRVNKFKYKSRNGKYCQRLPVYKSGDIVVLIYNSDLGQLSFQLFTKKEKSNNNNNNDNEKVSTLDSYIYNLPRDLTFYWFIGHQWERIGMTILD